MRSTSILAVSFSLSACGAFPDEPSEDADVFVSTAEEGEVYSNVEAEVPNLFELSDDQGAGEAADEEQPEEGSDGDVAADQSVDAVTQNAPTE